MRSGWLLSFDFKSEFLLDTAFKHQCCLLSLFCCIYIEQREISIQVQAEAVTVQVNLKKKKAV